ncbi:nucleotidyltransferase family protein [Kribbella sp. CA-247076]|uniref:nucleotidyltransferase family protein n=1 Tax=Kribbella sp. CA-247076 TaxID=3239941 RepID=UPI003D95061B
MKIAGLLLAAGAGRRLGTPKALVRDAAGVPWVVLAGRLLRSAGCSPLVVVVGASADRVRAELAAEPVEVVEATDWAEGMGASLRAGLHALASEHDVPLPSPDHGAGIAVALVVPVDVPGLTPDVLRRVAARADRSALVRATYGGRPGHPVVLGRDHWDGVIAAAVGDQGARAYFAEHPPVEVECGDLADGRDVDTVDDLPDGHRIG